MVTETADRTQYLEKRVEELEFKVRYRDEQLASEREINTKAKKKIKQLLAKLAERDEALAELRAALETARAAAAAASGAGAELRKRSGRRSESGRQSSSSRAAAGESQRSRKADVSASGSPKGLTSRDLAVRERADIVAQLEGHLAQMRANLSESEREVSDLEARRRAKEAEWKNSPEGTRTVESTQVHWQALSMIGQQIQEKRRFAAELTRKTRDLEEQVAQQRALIDGFCRTRGRTPLASAAAASATAPAAAAPPAGRPAAAAASAASGRGAVGASSSAAVVSDEEDQQSTLRREDVSGGAVAAERRREPSSASREPEACEDEALRAFLSAAGPVAEAILGRPSLRAAFEEQPPRLAADAVEGCSQEERVQVLSLFAAWAAVTGEPPRAMILEEMSLELPEVEELAGTLQTCGAQVEEWDMTRCPANDATMRALLQALGTQPLRRLNLGYNALGPTGACALVGVAPNWVSSLEHLSLEMNGLGDSGCREVAGALSRGLLPSLRVLELGWNELSAACAPPLAALLGPSGAPGAGDGGGSGERPESTDAAPRLQLQRLGLGGNRLGSEGAAALALAALADPSRALELDLSMNHVDSQPLEQLTAWAEACPEGAEVMVTINLEWNVIDDAKVAQKLVQAVGSRRLELGGLAGQPVLRLANNELADLEPSAVSADSRGLISC